ncbi:HAD family hydrolase [Sedimentibacter sp. zth1]|uniref:HAD family hydrolase n=1 Tax=Sedimentibacter sp. zth1 TaxID=2816908 RepID=UPI001A926372|nr:HAD family hydrolase [Sedimentibacter sp. zth1]QSX06344.1 HAD family hydrolase [Sedimentibacter sp. zth1]
MDSIIFDLDGTLWDSREAISKCWTELLSSYDVRKKVITVEDMTSVMGLLLPEIGDVFFEDLEKDKRDTLINECCNAEQKYLHDNGAKLFDKLEETLEILSKKYKLFIVSNCQDGYIETFLHAHNLGKYFLDYECPGRSGLKKAGNNKLIVKRNNLKSPIYVGDTQWDLNSAKEAGMPFVYARYGFGKDVQGYDYVIEKFDDLINLFI